MGDKQLFTEISFGIEEGQKTALIGVNGCGKSTLLKILAKKEQPDSGTVSWNRQCVINYLPQMPDFDPEDTILDAVFKSGSAVTELIKQYEKLCHHPENTDQYRDQLDKVMNEINRLDAWHFEYEIKSILGELGINDTDMKLGTLSGGMLKKVALAQALIDDGNLLVMDEPTNHLDIETVEWLQTYLKKTTKSILMVTHDRYFLDEICSNIIEIDRGTAFTYNGGYSFYLEKKDEAEAQLQREDQRQRNILRNEMKWLRRGAKARSTKQKARIERIHAMQDREVYREADKLELEIQAQRMGKHILEIKDVSKSYDGRAIIKPFTYTFKPKERLGIVGRNGAGKSTFLRLVTGEEPTDTGEVTPGLNTVFGVFDQHSKELDPDKRMIDTVRDIKEVLILPNGKSISAGQVLEKFLFPSVMHHTPIRKLSGGEKRRLHLVLVLMNNPNFLILDEPTNDIDIKTLSVLEDFLDDFPGCILVVSHDRCFMNRVADNLLIFDGEGGVEVFYGDFDDYLEEKKQAVSEEKKQTPKKEPEQPKTKKKKLSYNEQKEYDSLESDIENLEEEKSGLERKLNAGEDDYSSLADMHKRIEQIDELILEKMERWEYLSSLID
ncbi:MAG: ABC-F family ATP-binding cassette domain-containing protein [Deferribacterales bacterium]